MQCDALKLPGSAIINTVMCRSKQCNSTHSLSALWLGVAHLAVQWEEPRQPGSRVALAYIVWCPLTQVRQTISQTQHTEQTAGLQLQGQGSS